MHATCMPVATPLEPHAVPHALQCCCHCRPPVPAPNPAVTVRAGIQSGPTRALNDGLDYTLGPVRRQCNAMHVDN